MRNGGNERICNAPLHVVSSELISKLILSTTTHNQMASSAAGTDTHTHTQEDQYKIAASFNIRHSTTTILGERYIYLMIA